MRGWKARLQAALSAYGPVALGVWLALFGLTWGGFALAIGAGLAVEVEDAVSSAGTVGLAYAATQLTKPLRALGTLGLTPVVARALGRSPLPGPGEDEGGGPGEAERGA
jgi:hypothetical protein